MNSEKQQDCVLVVDDDPNNLRFLLDQLEKAGFKVLLAEKGESALKRIQYLKPDIILLDVMMPGIGGFETCRRLKAIEASKDIPVIFMTALNETEKKVAALELGAVDYITKPIQIAEVLARLKTHLALYHLQTRLHQQNEQLQQEIIQRQHLEEQLRLFLRATEQSANIILITDANGHIEFVNETFCTQTGYSYSEVVGKNPRFLNSGKQPSEFYIKLWYVLKNGQVWKGEILNQCKNGDLYWALETISPIKDEAGNITHYLAIQEDITERKKIREQLRKFSKAVEQSGNAISITDLKGKMEFVNSAFSMITGYSYEEAVGQTHRLLNSGKQSSEFYQKLWATIQSGYIWRGELINKRKDGEFYWTLETISPIKNKAGNTTNFLVVQEEITERKKIEQQLESQNQELQLKNAELEHLTQQLAEAQKEKLFKLNKAYERFVPQQFLSLLEKKSILEVQLGDQVEREMTILFSDIRNFTQLSEKMSPQDNFDFLNAYLRRMEPFIHQYQGIIDKYIGDAIMALFPISANDAVQAALSMLKTLTDYNQTRGRPGRPKFTVGIGINSGKLMLGTVGGQNRMEGTVISDTVNLASRVENLTKVYGTSLLITEQTYVKLDDPLQYHVRVLDVVKVKGKSEEVTVYEIYDGDNPTSIQLKDKTRDEFEEGFVLYHFEEFVDAQPFFERVLNINPNDKAAQIYMKRCEYFQKYGVPSKDWEDI
jgi:PAS domain S-box-containing protein